MFFYLPNGIDMPNWTPVGVGKLGELPRILKPLEPFREDMFVLWQSHAQLWPQACSMAPGDHGRCCASYLTGKAWRKTTTDIHVDGPMSMDQVIAGQIGHLTNSPRWKSAWTTPGNPVPAILGIPALHKQPVVEKRNSADAADPRSANALRAVVRHRRRSEPRGATPAEPASFQCAGFCHGKYPVADARPWTNRPAQA